MHLISSSQSNKQAIKGNVSWLPIAASRNGGHVTPSMFLAFLRQVRERMNGPVDTTEPSSYSFICTCTAALPYPHTQDDDVDIAIINQDMVAQVIRVCHLQVKKREREMAMDHGIDAKLRGKRILFAFQINKYTFNLA